MKAEWGKHLDDYLRNRESLSALVLIMDIRKPLTDFDNMMLDWSNQCELPTVILLTKSDKMKYGPAKSTYLQVKKALADHSSLVDVILFSSLKKSGVEEIRNTLTELVKAKMDT
jgi:GTP-binding protein